MDWVEYVNFIHQRIPQKEIEEQFYDYQCTRCLLWKKIGIRTTGRIYKQCNRCRETIENGRDRRKLKKTGKIKNEKGIEHISGK